MRILNKFYSLFAAFMVAVSIAVVIILFYILPNKKWQIRQNWAKFIRKLCCYKIEILGEFDTNAQMIILNHRSMLDIIVLEEIYPKNLSWIAKKQIEKIFFFGKIISKPKMISIDRENPRDFVRVINEAKDRLQDNRVISMFPEGTRNKKYDLLRFKKGAFMLANKLDLLVQPVVIIGAQEIMDSKKIRVTPFRTLKIIPLQSLKAEELENARELMQKVIDEFKDIECI